MQAQTQTRLVIGGTYAAGERVGSTTTVVEAQNELSHSTSPSPLPSPLPSPSPRPRPRLALALARSATSALAVTVTVAALRPCLCPSLAPLPRAPPSRPSLAPTDGHARTSRAPSAPSGPATQRPAALLAQRPPSPQRAERRARGTPKKREERVQMQSAERCAPCARPMQQAGLRSRPPK